MADCVGRPRCWDVIGTTTAGRRYYRRDLFWEQYEQGIDRIRQDPATWAGYARELEEEAGALGDGVRSE